IQALSGGSVEINNLSSAADTVTLQQALTTAAVAGKKGGNDETEIDVGPAGTAMRFLTAYLTRVNGNFLLTGSARMKQRPIGILVDALKTLGATIGYAGETGFPPLSITGGSAQQTAEVTVQGDVSSQYLSALLLIASAMPNGLKLRI